jgi:glycosyltransferase involved in cell wall biosynthesis
MGMIGAQRAFKMLDKIAHEIDVIHNHIGATALMFHQGNIPMVTTVHNNPKDLVEQTLYSDPDKSDVPLIGISNSHANNIPRFAHTVYNGIDVSSFEYSTVPGDYIFWMCRMDPCKGPELAIDTAVKAGVPLIMAGKIDTTEVEHFESEVRPRLEKHKDLVTFVGEIGHEEKNALMKDSICLINPIQWDEPFGLVPAESLASGAPVVATLRGSMPELIEDGITGYLIKDTEDKDLLTSRCAEAVLKCKALDRQACRNRAEQMFSVEKMVDGYIGVYKSVITKGQRSVQITRSNNELDLSIPIPALEMSS